MMLAIDKIFINYTLQVQRTWSMEFDGRYHWKAHKLSKARYRIKGFNKGRSSLKPMRSADGSIFHQQSASCTLEDFVYLVDRAAFMHIGTRAVLTSRQINYSIFFDDAFWPVNEAAGAQGAPCSFIRRHNRITFTPDLFRVLDHVGRK